MTKPALISALLDLAHELGREDRGLALLGEGNVSSRLDADSFVVKASGCNLATLDRAALAACRIRPLLDLLEDHGDGDEAVEKALLASRVNDRQPRPSVEAAFHAWLLGLPGVNFVGHTHPVAVNSVLCSRQARAFARSRLFPDEIVCCGPESVFVPYTDPGAPLAAAIRDRTVAFQRRTGTVPRVVLLENHGLIALGATAGAVLATTLMAEKAARILVGAASLGVRRLSSRQVSRIAGRRDEHVRRKVIGL